MFGSEIAIPLQVEWLDCDGGVPGAPSNLHLRPAWVTGRRRIRETLTQFLHGPAVTLPASLATGLGRPCSTGLAFMIAMGSAVSLTRFGGGAAFLWIANAVLLASLTTAHWRRWRNLLVACWLGGMVASGLWGLGWTAAPFISGVNIGEPLLAAALVRRWRIHRTGLDSARNLVLFILAAGVLAPACSGLLGSIVIGRWTGTPFPVNYWHWFLGHALGAVTFTPVFSQIAGGEFGRWFGNAVRARRAEALLLLVLVALVTAVVFAQSRLPLLFLPMLPLMLITFRVGRVGSASAVVAMAAIGTGLTLAGRGPVVLIDTGLGERLQFLQFYLAATVLTVLPVDADLARRHLLYERLRDSEARFRLLTESSTDIVMNLSRGGTICYVSPSIRLLGGYEPDALVGTSASHLVEPDDRERVLAVHAMALASPHETFTVEYRGIVPGDEPRWFETNTRAVLDEDGVVQGVVSAIRETSVRRRQETELARAALVDALTGVANRRAFDAALADRPRGGDQTDCVGLFDLDSFKAVNDRYGHAAGDEVLRAFAERAAAQVRQDDLLARVGGEEFAILFGGASMGVARGACERIRRAIENEPFQTRVGPVPITVSIGLAECREGDRSAAMERADAALYDSKHAGRNRLSLAA